MAVKTPRRYVSNEEYEKAYNNLDNRNVLHKVAHKFSGQLEEDQTQDCLDRSLWRALQYHDHNHVSKQKFTTSLHTFANWEFLREVAKKSPPEISVATLNHIPSGEATIPSLDMLDALENLEPDQKNIIHLRYYDNRTLQEIAECNGYSKETARQRLKKAEASLKEILIDTL